MFSDVKCTLNGRRRTDRVRIRYVYRGKMHASRVPKVWRVHYALRLSIENAYFVRKEGIIGFVFTTFTEVKCVLRAPRGCCAGGWVPYALRLPMHIDGVCTLGVQVRDGGCRTHYVYRCLLTVFVHLVRKEGKVGAICTTFTNVY